MKEVLAGCFPKRKKFASKLENTIQAPVLDREGFTAPETGKKGMMAPRIEDLWCEFCAVPSVPLQRALLAVAREWIRDELPTCDLDASYWRNVEDRAFLHFETHTFAVDTKDRKERVDLYPSHSFAEAGPHRGLYNATDRAADGRTTRRRHLDGLKMYAASVVRFFAWHVTAEKELPRLAESAESLYGSMVPALEYSARSLLDKSKAANGAEDAALDRLSDKLIDKWATPIEQRTPKQVEHWRSYGGALAYARVAVKRKAQSVAELKSTRIEAQNVEFDANLGDMIDAARPQAPEAGQALVEAFGQTDACTSIWRCACAAAASLILQQTTCRWAWFILGGVIHTKHDSRFPEKAKWLAQRDRLQRELLDVFGSNAIRDELVRPISRAMNEQGVARILKSALLLAAMPVEEGDDQRVNLKEVVDVAVRQHGFLRPEYTKLSAEQRKNVGWRLFRFTGEETRVGIWSEEVETQLPVSSNATYPQCESNDTPSRDEVASWTRAVLNNNETHPGQGMSATSQDEAQEQ